MRIALLMLLCIDLLAAADPQPASADPISKPTWAAAMGEDQHGTWADLVVVGVTQQMRFIPAGSFMMGSPLAENGQGNYQCKIILTHAFWLGSSTCTQGLWQQTMKENPSHFKGDPNLPVECVSWNDCRDFIDQVNMLVESAHARFPTEAEWEYACRAGTTGPYSATDLDSIAWYNKNSGGTTHPVMTKTPNPWGLYDMHGNVLQWCWNWDSGYDIPDKPYVGSAIDPQGPKYGWEGNVLSSASKRIIRGGSWCSAANEIRSADGNYDSPDARGSSLGFRVCISALPSTGH